MQSVGRFKAKHSNMFSIKVVVLVAAIFQLVFVHSVPVYEDSEGAASEHDYARVQIKVFRGPTEHNGHDHFAPWGYWVKQPADDHHH